MSIFKEMADRPTKIFSSFNFHLPFYNPQQHCISQHFDGVKNFLNNFFLGKGQLHHSYNHLLV